MSKGEIQGDKLSEMDTKLLEMARKLHIHRFMQKREQNRIVVMMAANDQQEQAFDKLYSSLSNQEKQLVAKQRIIITDLDYLALRFHRPN